MRVNRTKIRVFAAALVFAGLWQGCRTQHSMPDLGGLYNRVAQHQHLERNPVIVIPGILGTRLVDPESGRTVWGAFGGRQAMNIKRSEDSRLVALPMGEHASLRQLRDQVEPDGVLETIKVRLAGLPIELQAYFKILLTLGAGGFRDETLRLDSIDYGSDHYTCFQFDYDWRRDNIENAQRLAEFIRVKRAYVTEQLRQTYGVAHPDVKFDIIAHSMGGLVTRYFLRYGEADLPADGSVPEPTWAGAEFVEKAILVGTPNAGAVDSLAYLVNGRKFGPTTPTYEPALLGTFPSLYQLLPRPRHAPLAQENPGDFYEVDFWENQGWGLLSSHQKGVLQALLPDFGPEEQIRIARDHLRKSLARAKQFHQALDRPAEPPAGTDLYLIAGDAKPTARKAAFRDGKLRITDEGPGDGSVLRSSALMDERLAGDWQPKLKTPIAWKHVTFVFSDHLGMTDDPAFTDNILYLLLEAPDPASEP